jgi:D-3-phosphoglycerate dehydrogenase
MSVILFSAPYMLPSLDRFRPELERVGLSLIVAQVHERLEEAELLKYAGKFDGAICGDDRYSARVLAACVPRLKVISKWGTGIDSIDSLACENLGVKLFRTPNAFTLPVADSVIAYLLAYARRQPWMDRAMKAGIWEKLPGRALHECTLGVVGVGAIGKAVLRRAHAFGMKLLGNDIVGIDHVFLAETGVEMTTLDDLLSRADFVSINCDFSMNAPWDSCDRMRFWSIPPVVPLWMSRLWWQR